MTNPPAAEVRGNDKTSANSLAKIVDDTSRSLVERLEAYAKDWAVRSGNAKIVHEAISALTASEARADAAEMRVREAKSLLERILKYGEIGVVSISGFFNGLKPPNKEVWQVPRHMHADIEEVLAALAPAPGEAG